MLTMINQTNEGEQGSGKSRLRYKENKYCNCREMENFSILPLKQKPYSS